MMQDMQEYSFWLAALSIVLLFAALVTYGYSLSHEADHQLMCNVDVDVLRFYAYRIGNAIIILLICITGSIVIFRKFSIAQIVSD
jgi:uncharacterized membrane protein